MLLELCLCVVIFKTCFLNTVPHMNTFCVTPLALHMRHLSCVSEGIGQRLPPQTSSLAKCDLTLGGLPNGLGTLSSGPTCASIFLMRVKRKSV